MTGNSERLHAIAQLTRRTIGSVPLAQHAQEMVEQARALFGVDACVIRLWEGQDMVLLASSGLPEKSRHKRLPIGFGISKAVLEGGAPLFVPDVREHPVTAAARHCVKDSYEFLSYAGAPMMAGDRMIGILGLYSIKVRNDFTAEDLDCIQIMANSMSVAIANDGVYEQLAYEHQQLENEITARRRAEALLAQSEERLRLAAEAARMFAFEWDPATDQVTRSAECADILGISEDPMHDTGQTFFARVHSDDRPRLLSVLEQLSVTSPTYKTTYRVVRQDKRVIWLDESARGFFDADGNLTQLIGMTADVTEIKRAQQEAIQIREDLARVGRIVAMGELTATIAHEVNQPLSAVVVSAQACENLLNRPEPCLSDLREALKWIRRDALRAADVVQRVRDFLGRGRLSRSTVDLNAIIRAVVELASHRITATGVMLKLELDSRLPAVCGDRTQLQQIVLNLLTNAIDAVAPVADRSRLIVLTSRHEGRLVRASVIDSGVGLPPGDNPEQIFQPLFTTKQDGMGMGLAICRSIIEAHDGRLWAEPNPQGGAMFHFTIAALGQSSAEILG